MIFPDANAQASFALLWIVPTVPLPLPPVLCALTHRPPAWRIIRYLAYAGNGIAMP